MGCGEVIARKPALSWHLLVRCGAWGQVKLAEVSGGWRSKTPPDPGWRALGSSRQVGTAGGQTLLLGPRPAGTTQPGICPREKKYAIRLPSEPMSPRAQGFGYKRETTHVWASQTKEGLSEGEGAHMNWVRRLSQVFVPPIPCSPDPFGRSSPARQT